MRKSTLVIVIVIIVLLLALICFKRCRRIVFGGYNHFIVIDRRSQEVLNDFTKLLYVLAAGPRPKIEWSNNGAEHIFEYTVTFVDSIYPFATIASENELKRAFREIVDGGRYDDLFNAIVDTSIDSPKTIPGVYATYIYWNGFAYPGINCVYYRQLRDPADNDSFEERYNNCRKRKRERAYAVAITLENISATLSFAEEMTGNTTKIHPLFLKYADMINELRDRYHNVLGPEESRLCSGRIWDNVGHTDDDIIRDIKRLDETIDDPRIYLRRTKETIEDDLGLFEDMHAYTDARVWHILSDAVVDYLRGNVEFRNYWTKLREWIEVTTKPISVFTDRNNFDDDPFNIIDGLRHFNPGWIRHGVPGQPADSKLKVENITEAEYRILKGVLEKPNTEISRESIRLEYNDEAVRVPELRELNQRPYLVGNNSIFAYRGIGEYERKLDTPLDLDPTARHKYPFKIASFGYDFVQAHNMLGCASGFGLYATINPEIAVHYCNHLVYVLEIQYRRYHYLFIDRELDDVSARYLTNDYSPEGIVFPTERAIDMWLCCEYAKNDNITLTIELRDYIITERGIRGDPNVDRHVRMVKSKLTSSKRKEYHPWGSREVDRQAQYKNEFFRQVRSERDIMDYIAGLRDRLVNECRELAVHFDGNSIHAYDPYPPDKTNGYPHERLIPLAMQRMNVDLVVSYHHGNGRMKWTKLAEHLRTHMYPYELVLINGEGVRPRYAVAIKN